MSRMIFLADRNEGAEHCRADQPTNILRKQEDDDEARHIGRPLFERLRDARQHGRWQEQRATKGNQRLTKISIVRTREIGRVTIHIGPHRDENQRQPEDGRDAFKAHPHATNKATRQ